MKSEFETPAFRDLMLNYAPPETEDQRNWERSVRNQAEPLLLSYGKNPLYDPGLTEEVLLKALQEKSTEDANTPKKGIKRLLSRWSGSTPITQQVRLARLRNFLEQTPLRRIVVPFETQQLVIYSSLPELNELAKAAAYNIMHGRSAPKVPRYSIKDCDLMFMSTAWTPDNLKPDGKFYGYALGAEQLTREEAIKQKRFTPREITARDKQQVEGVLAYVQYSLSTSTVPVH